MQRLEPILDDVGIPQTTQTAYRKGVSCQDSIFAGMETNTRFLLEKEKVYICFYDLASAFDTLEFSVLLEELFREGIRGKCWRLVRHWYSNLVSQVKLGTHLSRPFHISRGIHQGSVFSPTLFNLVLDPLLSALKERNLGLNINGLYLRAFAHAYDIHTCATNMEDAAEQVSTVDTFTQSRGLKLFLEKCALLSSGHTPTNITVAETLLTVESSVKCLGVWWDSSLSSKT